MNSAVATRPRVGVEAPRLQRRSTWTYSFLLFHMFADSGDMLILVYASVLGMAPTQVGVVDALGSLGSITGLILVGKLSDRFGPQRWLLMLTLGAPALIMLGIAASHSPLLILLIAPVWGVVFAAPSPISSVVITNLFKRSERTQQQVRLSAHSIMGNSGGLVLALVWLAIAGHFWGDQQSIRMLYVIGAVLSVAAVFLGWYGLKGFKREQHDVTSFYLAHIHQQQPHVVAHWRPAPAPYSDRLKSLFVVTLVLYLGLGMSATLIPLYMTQKLHVASYAAMAPSMASALVMTVVLPRIGLSMSKPLSTRLSALAMAGRAGLMLLVGSVSFFASGLPAVGIVVVLMAVIGLCAAATSVANSTRLVSMLSSRHAGSTAGQYTALTFLSLAAGALLAGWVAQQFGFFPAYAVAAGWLLVAAALTLRL